LTKGDNKDYAPMSPILLFMRLSETLYKLTSLSKGDRRD